MTTVMQILGRVDIMSSSGFTLITKYTHKVRIGHKGELMGLLLCYKTFKITIAIRAKNAGNESMVERVVHLGEVCCNRST